ncbi:hypothetical protein COCNU_scaffold005066G000010 [Cocos nucifera]|nr:hypothetical protein [Cocos nucifera]
MARRFSKLDLNFLEEESDKEAGPFDAATDFSPVEVVPESSKPTVEMPKPMEEPKVTTKALIEPAPKPTAIPEMSSSSTASLPDIGGL